MEKIENFKIQLIILLIFEVLIIGLLAMLGVNLIVIFMMSSVILFNVFLVVWIMIRYDRENKNRNLDLTRILGNDANDALLFGEVGILVYDENMIVTWINDFLEERNIDLIGKKLSSWNSDLNKLFVDNIDNVMIHDKEHVYDVSRKENSTVIYVKDVTLYENMKSTYQSRKTVLGLIQLDNYLEVSQYEDENINSRMNTQLRQPVLNWAREYGMVIRRIRSDRFYVVLNEEIYEKIVEDRFSILNVVRQNSQEMGINVTMSMAIARGDKTLAELDEQVISLIEMAQNRGGDQVAVREDDQDAIFFGGNSEATEKRSRVRARVMAKAIRDALQETKKVFVVGHKNMDFDCMGANLAVSCIAQGHDKEVYIVSQSGGIEEQCSQALKQFDSELKKRHHFITEQEAMKMMKEEDLVFAVDFHNPDHCNAPAVLEKAQKVILIDHHRRSEKFIENPLLVYVETSASSVSELMTEFLPYMPHKVVVNEIEAMFLYLGILIDSNRFKARTGARTFEACATLRSLGVDPNVAEDLIKENIQEFEEKSSIMRYGRVVFKNMMLAAVTDKAVVTRTMMSKCADSMLAIKNIEASFVIAYTAENTVCISARSKGNINVQKLMETMNGGGHFSAAALMRENTTVEAVEEELMNVLKKNIEEELSNESHLAE